jgi:hypothetical protein
MSCKAKFAQTIDHARLLHNVNKQSKEGSMAKKKIKKAEIAATIIGDDFITIARRLREILEEKPDLFPQVANSLSLGIRKAYHLAEIDRRFHKLGVNRERLRRVGWTKLAILAPHVTTGNVDALLDIAESNTAHEIKRWLRDQPVYDEERCMNLYFSAEQYALIEKVLVEHGAIRSGRGLVGKEEALVAALGKIVVNKCN